MLRDRAVHLLLRSAGEDLLGLVNPALVLLAERTAVVGELIGQRALLEQAPQIDDRENLTAHGQHSQHVVWNVRNLDGSLHAQNLTDMLHMKSEFLLRDAKGDHLLDFGVGVFRVTPISQTWAALRAMTIRCPLSSFTTPSR